LASQSGKTVKVLIAGEEMRLNRTSVALNIRVTLEKNGKLTLYSQMDDEPDFIVEGDYKLGILPQSNYFGVVCIYSATRRNHFFFDDFKISPLTDGEDLGEGGSKEETSVEYVEVKPDIVTGAYFIDYNFPTYDNHCRLMVFDSGGRRISMPYNNEMIGSEGNLFWNGKDESGKILRRGIYIIYMEVYQSNGKVLKYKLPVVVK
jgi:hypothetical protein